MNEQTESRIRRYLQRSAGTCNHLSDHTIGVFADMVRREWATTEDFRDIGGIKLAVKVVKRLHDERVKQADQ